nr:MAG TPA: hypothetical protein [Caudoviricetes sp.]
MRMGEPSDNREKEGKPMNEFSMVLTATRVGKWLL